MAKKPTKLEVIEDATSKLIGSLRGIEALPPNVTVTVDDKAYVYALCKTLIDAVESVSKPYAEDIKKEGSYEHVFDNIQKKVIIVPGGQTSEISSDIFDVLEFEEIKQCAKVTETALKAIGKSELIDKYKTVTGTRASSVQVKSVK